MEERIYGLEVEYGLAHIAPPDSEALSPEAVSTLALEIANERLRNDSRRGPFWANGAKLYLDAGHLEWAGPECRSAREAVLFDCVGEVLVGRIAAATEASLAAEGRSGEIFAAKTNVDSAGNTFGAHENYLVRRSSSFIPREADFFYYLFRNLVPFLVSRTILCGSGHISSGKFHISQRAKFITQTYAPSTKTLSIVDGRDEPHTNKGTYRRLHLILGDANRTEWATFLKVGTTSLVLSMIEDVFLEEWIDLLNPVDALHTISADPSLRAEVSLRDGRAMTALEIQSFYLEATERYFGTSVSGEPRAILDMWRQTLEDLQQDVRRLNGKLDWVTKLLFLDSFRRSGTNVDWADPTLEQIDLKYHSLRPETSIFHALRDANIVHILISPEELNALGMTPPTFTRARARGEAVRRGAEVADWDVIKLPNGKIEDPLAWAPLGALRDLGLEDHTLLEWFQEGLRSEDVAVRCQALLGVRELQRGEIPGILSTLLFEDKADRVRAIAAESLYPYKGESTRSALLRACNDPHFRVRWQAEEVLRKWNAATTGPRA